MTQMGTRQTPRRRPAIEELCSWHPDMGARNGLAASPRRRGQCLVVSGLLEWTPTGENKITSAELELPWR